MLLVGRASSVMCCCTTDEEVKLWGNLFFAVDANCYQDGQLNHGKERVQRTH